MTQSKNTSRVLQSLWASFPPEVQKGAATLSAAVALTDDLAQFLLTQTKTGFESKKQFILALRGCDFVSVRNGEWRIEQDTRQYLLSRLIKNRESTQNIHRLILSVISNGVTGIKLPAYLKRILGKAYHTTFLNPQEGLALYRQAFFEAFPGEDWLAGRLAAEQQAGGWIPQDALEPDFYQGMAAHRERDLQKAEKHLGRVCQRDDICIEVAISLHMVGLDLWHRHHRLPQAEEYLRRSLAMREHLHDSQGKAHVLHSLANLICRRALHKGRNEVLLLQKEAETYLLSSLDILGSPPRDSFGMAKVLNSLGILLSDQEPSRAEGYLRRSLTIEEELENSPGQGQALHSLGKLVAKNNPQEGEDFLCRSLKIRQDLGDSYSEAKVFNSLGSLYKKWERDDWNRSLCCPQDEDWGQTNWDRSLFCFQKVIDISENSRDLAIAYDGISQLWKRKGNINKAAGYLRKAIEYQEKTDSRQRIPQMRDRLQRLEELLEGYQSQGLV